MYKKVTSGPSYMHMFRYDKVLKKTASIEWLPMSLRVGVQDFKADFMLGVKCHVRHISVISM